MCEQEKINMFDIGVWEIVAAWTTMIKGDLVEKCIYRCTTCGEEYIPEHN